MALYSHILLAVDFHAETPLIVERARAMQEAYKTKLSLVHVIEPIGIAYGGEFPLDLGDLHRELEKQGREKLAELGQQLGVPAEQQLLEVGITEREILRVAKEQAIDLIVLGSHGRHGLALLLGSTANAVLHRSQCDVLAVRVGKQKSA
ncbi:Universal stress protein, UspA [gamma proteobacterium HdN1]|nr:Universal stress protein, UspA [gamma proteobacterium HdN1]